MATGLHLCSRASALAPEFFQRRSERISPAPARPSRVSFHRPRVSAEYNDQIGRRGGGRGDFVAGVLLGGAVLGALCFILAPHISKPFEEVDTDIAEDKRPLRFLEDDEDLKRTRQNLNEKIAQLNAAIDNVSAQLRNEEDLGTANKSAA